MSAASFVFELPDIILSSAGKELGRSFGIATGNRKDLRTQEQCLDFK
jgi:hypothetical protein